MTDPDQPEGEPDEPSYAGTVIIEWPAANPATPYSTLCARLLKVTDAVTGKLLPVCGVTVRADPVGYVTADLVVFTDADGNPLYQGRPVFDGVPVRDGDELRTETRTFTIAEMRVRA